MRIIAGRFHGHFIQSPKGWQSRPTLSLVREAIFNILAPRISGSAFLDLYAGVGSVGLEALSRGSEEVVFVESDRKIARVLSENIKRFDPEGRQTRLIVHPALPALPRLAGEKFDLIFLDPPYSQKEIDLWSRNGHLDHLLTRDGLVILQHSRREKIPDLWAGCEKIRTNTYGDTQLAFFKAGAKPIIH